MGGSLSVMYPKGSTHLDGSHIIVAAGKSVAGIEFRPPDYGRKRRVVVRVLDMSFQPVAGATVQDEGLHPQNPKLASSGARLTTNSAGELTLDLWPLNDYFLCARFERGRAQAPLFGCNSIHAGHTETTSSIVMKDS